jgi:hypothetical protein
MNGRDCSVSRTSRNRNIPPSIPTPLFKWQEKGGGKEGFASLRGTWMPGRQNLCSSRVLQIADRDIHLAQRSFAARGFLVQARRTRASKKVASCVSRTKCAYGRLRRLQKQAHDDPSSSAVLTICFLLSEQALFSFPFTPRGEPAHISGRPEDLFHLIANPHDRYSSCEERGRGPATLETFRDSRPGQVIRSPYLTKLPTPHANKPPLHSFMPSRFT